MERLNTLCFLPIPDFENSPSEIKRVILVSWPSSHAMGGLSQNSPDWDAKWYRGFNVVTTSLRGVTWPSTCTPSGRDWVSQSWVIEFGQWYVINTSTGRGASSELESLGPNVVYNRFILCAVNNGAEFYFLMKLVTKGNVRYAPWPTVPSLQTSPAYRVPLSWLHRFLQDWSTTRHPLTARLSQNSNEHAKSYLTTVSLEQADCHFPLI